jgi:hypothetical protein
MNERAKRLKKVYEYLFANLGIHSQKEFAEAIKMQRTGLSAAMNGNASYLTDNLFLKICSTFPGVFNIDYLLTGIGDLTLRENKNDVTSISNSRNVNQNPSVDMSSVINSIIAAKDETIATLQKQLASNDEAIKSLKAQVTRLETMLDQKDDIIAILTSQAHGDTPLTSYPYPVGVSDEKKQRKHP